MKKLEKAKEIVKEFIEDGGFGIFNTRNVMGDRMETLYDEDGLQVDICIFYGYFEVFGLSKDEFAELKKYYNDLLED